MTAPARTLLLRFARFNAVGAVNITMKLALLAALREWAGMGYLAATAVAVEAALLNGFFWHQRWTWGDRRAFAGPAEVAARLARHHAANGLLVIAVNLAVVRALVGVLGVHYLPAAAIATLCAGLIGFFLSDRLIFVGSALSGRAGALSPPRTAACR